MKVFFDTMGCPKNVNDSEMAAGLIGAAGHEIVTDPEQADVIVVNTCGFIEDAKRESIAEIFRMANWRVHGKKLVVTGCLVQRYAADLAREIPEADAFLGVNDYASLPEVLDQLDHSNPGEERFVRAGGVRGGAFAQEMKARRVPEGTWSTTLRIAEGCDNCCSYCAIPSIRGPYRSRPIEDIVAEAESLAQAGVKELSVIAEDTGCYGRDLYGRIRLPELLERLDTVSGIRWIRLLYCYEDHIDDALVRVLANGEKILPYIDIPLQHISANVLRRMNRASTPDSIRQTIARLRKAMPKIAIRTTMIVGFPGETEDDYGQLLEFVEETGFARLGCFAFSCEEGTKAADLPDQIPDDIKQERLDGLMTLQQRISAEQNTRLIGRVVPVLVDEIDPDGVSLIGRTESDAPEIDDSVIFTPLRRHRPGEFVRVKITDAFDYDLQGIEVLE